MRFVSCIRTTCLFLSVFSFFIIEPLRSGGKKTNDMEAVDNPSYFTLPSEGRRKKTTFPFLRKRSDPTDVKHHQQQQQLITQPSSGSIAGIASLSSSTSGNRRNRILSRSISEDTHLLVLGKPRPTDMAPSVYSVNGNHIHNRSNHHHHHRNIRSATMPRHLLSSDGLLHQDMILCGAVSASRNDENDVFLNNDQTTNGKFINRKYYNTAGVASSLPVGHWLSPGNHRRHSVGSSVLQRANSTVGNSGTNPISIRPNLEDGIVTTARTIDFRKRCNKLLSEKASNIKSIDTEEDILLLASIKSEAASLWLKYLISCFQQISKEQNRSPFRISKVHLEDILSDGVITSTDLEKYSSARLQIVIICPQFLQETQRWPIQQEIPLGKIIHSDRVIAMLLGVTETSVTIQLKPTIPSYDNWRRMIVKDQDPTFVGDFLGIGMDILSRSWHLREAIGNSVEQTDAMFSILPKKVKVGQNKLIVLLTDPLSSDDVVKVFIEKNGSPTEVPNVKRRNPYTLQFSAPISCLQVSALVHVQVEKNDKCLGRRLIKCENKMRELDQLLRSVDNPMQFMCQSFNLNMGDREQLDNILLNAFQRNMPPNLNLLQPLPNKYQICNEEYPTLLHFSAKYGLEKLSWQLLESPGGEQACQLRNSSQLVPSEMAEKAGHSKLATALKGYMQMTELSSVYNYLKGLEDKSEKIKIEPMESVNSIQAEEGIYLLPKLLNDTYLIPPAARPVCWKIENNLVVNDGNTTTTAGTSSNSTPIYYANFKPCNFAMPSSNAAFPNRSSSENFLNDHGNYQVPRNGKLCIPQSPRSPTSPEPGKKIGAYMDMACSGSEFNNNFGSTSTFSTSDFQDNFGSFGKLDTCESTTFSMDNNSSCSDYRNRSLGREKLSPDEELLEIINDFKNNVFTISEVEQLVQSWQNRNDVQQSFREKQEQLNKMREEYDRIQRKVREQMKRPTPFEKIRRFFGRNKSKHSESSSRTSISSDTSTNTSNYRPPSSISLQSTSSGSSGRDSIASGNSIYYDSNQHHSSDSKSNLHEKLGSDNNTTSTTRTVCSSASPKYIPQPPKYLNLSASYDECSSSDYSPMDTPIDGNGLQIDNAIRILRNIDNLDSNHNHNNNNTTDNHNGNNRRKTKINDYCNVRNNQSKHFESNIGARHIRKVNNLTVNTKSPLNKKAKSEENLLHDRNYANMTSITKRSGHVDDSAATRGKFGNNYDSSPRLNEACRTLCEESVKCLADITINLTVEQEEEEEQTCSQSGDEFSFKCDKALNNNRNLLAVNDNDLDNSSFSLNSINDSMTDPSRPANDVDEKNVSSFTSITSSNRIESIDNVNENEEKRINESGSQTDRIRSDDEHLYDSAASSSSCKFPEYVNIVRAPISSSTLSTTTTYKYGTVTM